MNILVVSQMFWPETFRINDLVDGLIERGHQVNVLTGKPNYPGGKFYSGYTFLNKNIEYYGKAKVYRSPLIPRGNNKFQLALNYLSFAFFASILGILKCEKPDVIFVFEPSPITVALPAIFYKKLRKVPILLWVQDLWPESVVAVNAIRSKKILRWLEKLVFFIYTHCDYILTTSRGFFDPIKKFQVPDEKLRFFPQTAESLFKPIIKTDCQTEEKLLPKGFRIIFSGNIGAAQDIETIIQTALLLRDKKEIKWIFLGEGSKRTYLQAAIKKNKLSDTVFWLGHYPLEKMPYFFSCADALLVTLKKDNIFSLTIPGKIQSYLACAKPIIAALDGEGRRIIEEAKAGITAQAGDSKALANAVLNFYQLHFEERNQMGINGYDYFNQHFKRDLLLQTLENWMFELKEKNKNENFNLRRRWDVRPSIINLFRKKT